MLKALVLFIGLASTQPFQVASTGLASGNPSQGGDEAQHGDYVSAPALRIVRVIEVTDGGTIYMQPIWSPDGKKLAFTKLGFTGLYVRNADGSGPIQEITSAAYSVLADHGCLVAWCGEEGVRLYAVGMGETRSASNFLHQVRMWADTELRMQVVRRLYQLRFSEKLDPALTIRQIRGMEGIRVREGYARAAQETGVPWSGRSYRRDKWNNADPVNRALSTANSCLYGICHSAVVSAGFSPVLGFIHTGKMLSFVYDIADLYKTGVTVPVAFRMAAEGKDGLERRVRLACRDMFTSTRLLEKIIPDVQMALAVPKRGTVGNGEQFDWEPAAPASLWDPEEGKVEGGRIHLLEVDEREASDGSPDP